MDYLLDTLPQPHHPLIIRPTIVRFTGANLISWATLSRSFDHRGRVQFTGLVVGTWDSYCGSVGDWTTGHLSPPSQRTMEYNYTINGKDLL